MIVKPALSASVISENVISLSPIVMLLSLIITFFMVINRPFFFYFLGIKIAPFTDVKDACLRLAMWLLFALLRFMTQLHCF